MDDFDRSFTKAILTKLKERLKRELTATEIIAFTLQRSGIVYEMIMDYISDERKSKDDIESKRHRTER